MGSAASVKKKKGDKKSDGNAVQTCKVIESCSHALFFFPSILLYLGAIFLGLSVLMSLLDLEWQYGG